MKEFLSDIINMPRWGKYTVIGIALAIAQVVYGAVRRNPADWLFYAWDSALVAAGLYHLHNWVLGTGGAGGGPALIDRENLKGASVTTPERLATALAAEGPGLVINRSSGLTLPMKRIFSHMLIAGKTGTGKSSILLPIVDQILERAKTRKCCIILLDVKGDMTAMYARPGATDVHLLNPADKRSISFCLDVETITDAEHLAAIMAAGSAKEGGKVQDPFWERTSQQIFAGVLLGCKAQNIMQNRPNPGKIRWEQIYDAVVDRKKLKRILKLTDKGALVVHHLNEPKTANTIMSVLISNIEFISELKRAWPDTEFSVKDFIRKGEGMVIARYSEKHPALTAKTIGTFLEQCFAEILTSSDVKYGQEAEKTEYYLILDELQNLPPMHSLGRILSLGRSKNCAVFFTFQSTSKMHEIYHDDFNNIFEMPANHIYLSAVGETAEYCSKAIGDQELLQTQTSENKGRSFAAGQMSGQSGVSVSQQITQVRAVLAGEIAALPTPTTNDPSVRGFLRTTGHGAVMLTWPCGLQQPQVYPEFIPADWIMTLPIRQPEPDDDEEEDLVRIGADKAEMSKATGGKDAAEKNDSSKWDDFDF